MWRGVAKAGVFAALGRVPGGADVYRTITRDWMGTQATHVDKLRRVWPGYVELWRSVAGVEVEGADLWVFEGGCTPFPSLAAFLVTGRGGVVSNRRSRVLDRYLARAVNGAIGSDLPAPRERRAALEPLRWAPSARAAIASVGGRLLEGVPPDRIPLPDASVDLCHSGGVLEHEEPRTLAAFLRECRRILRPGAVMSHVVDHRDHLHHADPSWPYLGHLRLGPRSYRALFGHPLGYHSRLPPEEVRRAFERAGFDLIALRRMPGPSGSSAAADGEVLAAAPGLDRGRLARAFRDMSELDLRTAAAHYLYRNPG
jgi:SAM-dependent methyltransferase